MYCRNTSWLICMFVAVSLATVYRDPLSTKEWSLTESVQEVKHGAGDGLGPLLDTGEGAIVTVEAGATRLVAHRAVLAARSPLLATMLRHYSVEVDGSRLSFPDVEGPVLRHLVAYLYTLQAPQLLPGTATQLLVAAHKFGLPALRADCEQQVATQLSVETVASVAVLRDTAVNFIKDHFFEVLATKGWSDALENQPKEATELSNLLAGQRREVSMAATVEAGATPMTQSVATPTTEAGATPTTQSAATPTTEAGAKPTTQSAATPTTEALATPTTQSAATSTMEARATPMTQCSATPTTEAVATPTTQSVATPTTEAVATPTAEPHSDRQTTPATAAPITTNSTPTTVGANVSHLPSISKDEKDRRLIEAAEKGALEELQSLLEAGADVGSRDAGESTALHRAARWGHVEAVRILVCAGADVGAKDVGGSTALHWAAYKGHVEVMSSLLDAGAGTATGNSSPLCGRATEVRLLAASVADPNATDEDGRTPLHLAALRGHTGVVAALLQAGADREATDRNGKTPLDLTRQNNRWQLIDMLSAPVTMEAGATATMEAETTATTQPLCHCHCDPCETTTTAAPPHAACPTSPLDEATVSRLRRLPAEERGRRLVQAAEEGAVGELRSLLAAGADVGARGEREGTALHHAAERGHVEAVSCLLGGGAEVDARNNVPRTPLHLAAMRGHAAVVRLLLAASADPNARDGWRYTPLHVAAWKGHAVVVPLLLAASADPNARDVGGDTPLHNAALFDRAEVAAALLEGRANRRARNNEGRTPLDEARRKNHQQLIDILTQC